MKVFEDIIRYDKTPQSEGEDTYSFLSRSGTAESAKARERIETWLGHIPSIWQEDMTNGLMRNIEAKYFELFMHELLLKLGYKTTIHPGVMGTVRHPDFLAEQKDGERVYIETTIIFGRNPDSGYSVPSCTGPGSVNDPEQARMAMLHALHEKVERYGALKEPFIIALNNLSNWQISHEDIASLLYGCNGQEAFCKQNRHRGLSGVLYCEAYPCIPSASARLYHNSHARHRYNGALSWLDTYCLGKNGEVKLFKGKDVNEILR